ncbi:hypothetical protein FKM82_005520 [Ascaphus truei]
MKMYVHFSHRGKHVHTWDFLRELLTLELGFQHGRGWRNLNGFKQTGFRIRRKGARRAPQAGLGIASASCAKEQRRGTAWYESM